MPRKVSAALDALDEPDLTAPSVMTALDVYLRVVSLSRADLTHEHNDWTEFVIPKNAVYSNEPWTLFLTDTLRSCGASSARPTNSCAQRR